MDLRVVEHLQGVNFVGQRRESAHSQIVVRNSARPHSRAICGRRDKILPALPAAQTLVIQPQVFRWTQDGIAVRTLLVTDCAYNFDVVLATPGHCGSLAGSAPCSRSDSVGIPTAWHERNTSKIQVARPQKAPEKAEKWALEHTSVTFFISRCLYTLGGCPPPTKQ
jgi:hypothetical protein